MLKEAYVNNRICSCVFIKKLKIRLTICSICRWFKPYRNSWRAHKNNQLFKEGIWNERFRENKIFSKPTSRVLFKWNISPSIDIYRESIKMILYGQITSTQFPMVVRTLEVNKDLFRFKEENEELLSPRIPYLSVNVALMHLANCTRPDITFFANLLTRYNFAPTRRH